jgi:hypothetical protein
MLRDPVVCANTPVSRFSTQATADLLLLLDL